MSQPRYDRQLKEFIHQWRPNKPELDQRFMDDVKALLAAILRPPSDVFEVETILTPAGGKVVCRLGDYEAQLDPVQAHHLALSLIEGASSARLESLLYKYMREAVEVPEDKTLQMIAIFRGYRTEEMRKEFEGELAKQTVIPKDGK